MQDPLHPSPSKGKISFTYFSKSLNQDYSSSTSFDLGLYVHMIFDLLIRSLIMECYTHFGHHPKLARQCSHLANLLLMLDIVQTLFFPSFIFKPVTKLISRRKTSTWALSTVVQKKELGFICTRTTQHIPRVLTRGTNCATTVHFHHLGLLWGLISIVFAVLWFESEVTA